jgi:hypothetical protein
VGFGIKTLSSGIGGAKKWVHRALAYPAFLLSGLPFRHIRSDTRDSTVLCKDTYCLIHALNKADCGYSSSSLSGGKSWRTKTNCEYSQNLLRLFGIPCCLIGPVAVTWCTCDCYVTSESPIQSA